MSSNQKFKFWRHVAFPVTFICNKVVADYEKSSMRKWRKRQKNPKMLRNPEVKKIGLQLKKLAMNYWFSWDGQKMVMPIIKYLFMCLQAECWLESMWLSGSLWFYFRFLLLWRQLRFRQSLGRATARSLRRSIFISCVVIEPLNVLSLLNYSSFCVIKYK